MKYILPTMGCVAAAALFAFSSTSRTATAVERPSHQQTFEQLELFGDVLSRVRNEYVVDVEDKDLIEEALNGMLQSLDPHSSYMNPENFREMQNGIRGEYGGLGMEVIGENGYLKIVTPIDDTPASRAGIESGDYITEVDGESIRGLTQNEAVELLRGPPGKPVTVTVARENEDDVLKITMTRETIKQRMVRSRLEDGMPYIRLTAFSTENTGADFEDAIKKLKAEVGGKLPGLIVDLRNNPGGLLDQSVRVSSAFLDGGEVVSVRSRDPKDTERYNAKRGELLEGVPVVVLINGGSASAAEIVAGALQDRQRAIVLGMTSFGKGSVQSILALEGGRKGALRLTTARYYTPAGRSIQGTGVQPDIAISYAKDDGKDRKRFSEADLPNSIRGEAQDAAEQDETEIKIDFPPEDWDEEDDYQIKRAIEILKSPNFKTMLMAEANP